LRRFVRPSAVTLKTLLRPDSSDLFDSVVCKVKSWLSQLSPAPRKVMQTVKSRDGPVLTQHYSPPPLMRYLLFLRLVPYFTWKSRNRPDGQRTSPSEKI
jgi:hypothetical protein